MADQLKEYIDTHYQQDIRRETLAELVYLNVDYMSRIFKKEAGISISAYLMQKRVEEAKNMLTRSSLPINTVSIYVGTAISPISQKCSGRTQDSRPWNTAENSK